MTEALEMQVKSKVNVKVHIYDWCALSVDSDMDSTR